MDYKTLGKSNLKVSKIGFGTLTTSPLQRNFSAKMSRELFLYAFNKGINFFDTAELYNNYDHFKLFLENINRDDVIISTKSYAYSKDTAKKSLSKALDEMKTDYIDIFMLHEQESEHTLRGHYEALEYFLDMKEKGIIKSIGISTHFINGVLAANKYEDIDVIHPIVNKKGLGIQDGSIKDMLNALDLAKQNNKGIFAMKPLGGGNLLGDFEKSLDFIKNLSLIDSIAIGMQSEKEVDINIDLLINDNYIPDKYSLNINRKLIIDQWCEKCGKCIQRCNFNALKLKDGKVDVDRQKCTLCGYCSTVCANFYIKII